MTSVLKRETNQPVSQMSLFGSHLPPARILFLAPPLGGEMETYTFHPFICMYLYMCVILCQFIIVKDGQRVHAHEDKVNHCRNKTSNNRSEWKIQKLPVEPTYPWLQQFSHHRFAAYKKP